ncbi:hypothetical protein D9756_004944 [Leucocoprinus leucothites]|uniref:Uncharacterized protein n=1 Tax=Leucocoprinus leucothites TaxID=201217 RepID=A0A8H5G9Y1_9AGAR|nr:hypothetical protein D9756_004944 [Leucoagaricus leucothites]
MAPLFVALPITEAIEANITVNTTVTTGPNGSSADSNDSYWNLSLSLFLIGTAVTIVIVICTVAFSTLAHKQSLGQRISLVLPQRLPVSMPEVQSTQFLSTQGIQALISSLLKEYKQFKSLLRQGLSRVPEGRTRPSQALSIFLTLVSRWFVWPKSSSLDDNDQKHRPRRPSALLTYVLHRPRPRILDSPSI